MGDAGLKRIHIGKIGLGSVLVALGFPGSLAFAQPMTVQLIKELVVVDIPFVLGDVEAGERSDMLWAKGDKPANPLLARFSIRPVQAATLAVTSTGQPSTVLWRAFPGGGVTLLRSDELNLKEGPRYFCGAAVDQQSLSCFVDEDGNGSFERVADAIPERGTKPYHITLIKASQPLAKPLPYTIVSDEQRPAVTIALSNCGKDYDYPRYAANSTEDRALPVMPVGLGWHDKDSSFASCRRGRQIGAAPDDRVAIPSGGYLAQIGPLAFTVGPKQKPTLALVGPVDRSALYRLEGASLVDISIGHTPNQAQLLAMKKFPYPMMMTEEGATLHNGILAPGGRLASVPFRHAYRGKLTQDVIISTLFGKRSLPAGTVLYGFAAQSRISRTVRGIPDMQAVGDAEYRKINLELTWCAPVRGTPPVKEGPNAVGKNGWSAACVPHSMMGNHTIIADMQPAFAITGVSYSVETASNEGRPPIERADDTAFDKPLRIEYLYEGRDAEFVSLREQIYYGDELTSSRPNKLYAPSGAVMVDVAGMQAELTTADNGSVNVKPSGAPVIGSSPILKWDQDAYFRQQLMKMGMKAQDFGAAVPAPTAPSGDTAK